MFRIVKNQLQFNKFLNLCTLNPTDNLYYSKIGNEYINALKENFEVTNSNDLPFNCEDITIQPILSDFNFQGINDFKYVCQLTAKPMILNKLTQQKENEKILVQNLISKENIDLFYNTFGLVYIITCNKNNNEHIIKIGSTRLTFENRLNSYNCGCISNYRTASTTNIKILQSFLTTRETFNLYLCDCSDENKSFNWYNKISSIFASSKSLAYEDILIKEFIHQFNQKPLANVQANATTLEI